ncbi:MAG TPA: hypothetical protein PLG66_08070, partial [Calditrichia bacterium]|nr:hypothetical protein [Calditrichia bacterium]
MSKMSGVFLIGLWGVLLFWGCSNTPNDPAVTDPEVAVEDLAADEENDYLYDLGLDDQVEENMYVGYSSYSSDPQIPAITVDSTIRFGRKINRRAVRRVVVERLAPDTLLVRTRRDLAGFFFVFHQTDSATWRGFRKPMHHIAERSAIYVNTGSRDTDNRRNWQLQAVSLGSGRSATDASIRIHSVTVLYNNGADTLGFRNPAET